MSRSDRLMGVILAAGKGTRMLPFSTHYPKPILPVLGKPLLAYQVEMMARVGIRDIVIVIGHLGHEVVRALGDGSGSGVRLEFVEQEETLGIAHAVSKLEQHVDRPFFLFLGDIFFEFQDGADLQSMLDRLGRSTGGEKTAGVIAVRREPDPEAIKRNFIVMEDDGRVVRVIEKPRHPKVDVKGCGIYLFETNVFDAVRRTPRTAMRDEYEITDAIQIFIDDGYRVEAADVVRRDLNLSYPADLLDLNLDLLEQSGAANFLGRAVHVDAGAHLERCLLLDGARVESPITLRDSLVFPGVVVRGEGSVTRTILTPDAEILCDGGPR